MIRITHERNLRVKAESRGFTVYADQDVKSGGDDSAMSPYELFLASLGLCVISYFVYFCRKRNLDPHGVEITVDQDLPDSPDKFRKMIVSVTFPPGFPEKHKNAARKFCEVCSVGKAIKIGCDVVYEYR